MVGPLCHYGKIPYLHFFLSQIAHDFAQIVFFATPFDLHLFLPLTAYDLMHLAFMNTLTSK